MSDSSFVLRADECVNDYVPRASSHAARRSRRTEPAVRFLPFVAVVSVVAAFAVAAASAGTYTSVTPHGGEAPARTRVYDLRGKIVFTLFGWCDRNSEYCTQARRGRIYVSFTHHSCGGAVRVAPRIWKAWVGRRLVGTIVARDHRRADMYSRSGRKIGYAIGAYPVRAAAMELITGGPFSEC